MTFELDPKVVRLIPFPNTDGPGVAAVKLAFGPIHISTKLMARPDGSYFLSFPARHSQAKDRWYDQVSFSDSRLVLAAQSTAVKEYERVQNGELVAV